MNINNIQTGNVNIPGPLHSTASDSQDQIGNVVAYAGDIYDTQFSDGVNTGMNQAAINAYLKANSGSSSSSSSPEYIAYSTGQGYSIGDTTTASGENSFAEGSRTVASGAGSHAEGADTIASGDHSHAEGEGTETTNTAEHASGKYNQSTPSVTQFSVGIGADGENRANAFEVDVNGNIYIQDIGNYDGTNIGQNGVKSVQQIITELTQQIAALTNNQ